MGASTNTELSNQNSVAVQMYSELNEIGTMTELIATKNKEIQAKPQTHDVSTITHGKYLDVAVQTSILPTAENNLDKFCICGKKGHGRQQ